MPIPTLRAVASARVYQTGDSMPVITPRLLVDGKERMLPDCWGFSDGQHLYIRYQGRYAPLARQGNAFVFSVPLAGSAHKPVVHILDLIAGRAMLFADAGRPASRTDTARIYEYGQAGSGPGQPVFLNGAPVGTLAGNQVLVLPWADPVHEPRLRLGPLAPN